MACQLNLNSLRKELETMSESQETEIDSNESEIMKNLRVDIRQGVNHCKNSGKNK